MIANSSGFHDIWQVNISHNQALTPVVFIILPTTMVLLTHVFVINQYSATINELSEKNYFAIKCLEEPFRSATNRRAPRHLFFSRYRPLDCPHLHNPRILGKTYSGAQYGLQRKQFVCLFRVPPFHSDRWNSMRNEEIFHPGTSSAIYRFEKLCFHLGWDWSLQIISIFFKCRRRTEPQILQAGPVSMTATSVTPKA